MDVDTLGAGGENRELGLKRCSDPLLPDRLITANVDRGGLEQPDLTRIQIPRTYQQDVVLADGVEPWNGPGETYP